MVEAAIDLGSNQGYDRTRTREIAQAAYISEGGMFRHFHSKADLFADAFEVAADDLLNLFATPMAHAVRTKDVDELDRLIRSLGSDRRLRLVIDVLSASQFDEELAERLQPMNERVVGRLEAAVADASVEVPATSDHLLQGVQTIFEQLIGRMVMGRAIGRDIDSDPVIGELAQQVIDLAH